MTSRSQRKQSEKDPRVDWDGAWKEAIQQFFGPFMQLLFPEIHALIDWTYPAVFLEQEFRQVKRKAKIGKNSVDKLARVRTLDGTLTRILIHMEFQHQVDQDIILRLYNYNTTIYSILREQVATLAILGDSSPDWKPATYSYTFGNYSSHMQFPIAKLLDYGNHWSTLESSDNPFAVVVMAHLKSLETHGNPETRLEWKLRIAELLYSKGYSTDSIFLLIQFIDWLMPQNSDFETLFESRISLYEEQHTMDTLSPMQKRYIAKGREEGKLEGKLEGRREALHSLVLALINSKFAVLPPDIQDKVMALSTERAETIAVKLISANSLAELEL